MVFAAATLATFSTASAGDRLQLAHPRAAKQAIAKYNRVKPSILKQRQDREMRALNALAAKLKGHKEQLKKDMQKNGEYLDLKDFIDKLQQIRKADLGPKVTKEEIEKLKYRYDPKLYGMLQRLRPQRLMKSAKQYSQKYMMRLHAELMFIDSDIFSIIAQFFGLDDGEEEPTTPAAQTLELGTPYAYEVEVNGGCNECTFGDVVAGSMFADRWSIFLGWGAFQGGLAHVVDVPAGYSTLRVTSEMEITDYEVTAFSDLIGAGQASASAVLEVFHGNNVECEVRQQQAYVIAPIIWFAQDSGQGVAVMECTVEVDPAGGQYVITNLVEAQTFAAGTNLANSSISGQMQGLTVELF